MEKVILVDQNDNQIGEEEKIQAHKEAKLHRAFSLYIFNRKGELMLQHRALQKYHGGGLWTNTVCGHPRPGEEVEAAVHRRMEEEMGFDTTIEKLFEMTYKVEFENGLYEHEYLHVYGGIYEGKVYPNPDEAEGYKWVNMDSLFKDMQINPQNYTPWFQIVLKQHFDQIKSYGNR